MRKRTQQFLLDEETVNELLQKAEVGRLGVVTAEGKPYIVPLNFVYDNGSLYIHGAPEGLKMESLMANKNVCFEVDEMYGLRYEDPKTKCNVGAKYKSVIAFGQAFLLEDMAEKINVLNLFIEKYAPFMKELPMPEAAVRATAVVKIKIESITGKQRE